MLKYNKLKLLLLVL